jgi:hypothetical protein
MTGPLDNGQGWAVLIGAATFLLVALVALRGHWLYPITHGAVALALLSLCYGLEVFAFPGEGIRVMAPTQVLLLIAACASGGVRSLTPPSAVRTRRRVAHDVRASSAG